MGLPLEGLSILKNAKSVSRDFSLHLLDARRHQGVESTENAAAVKKSDVTFIADPRNEDIAPPDGSRRSISKTLKDAAEPIGISGVCGDEGIPSTGVWQRTLCERGGGGIMFFGLGRCLAYVPPNSIAGMRLGGCHVALLLDRAESDASNRRQSKLDNLKTFAQRQLERPLQTAALFSTVGIRSIMLNRHSNAIATNCSLVEQLLPVLNEGIPVAEAVHQCLRGTPPSIPLPDTLDDEYVRAFRDKVAATRPRLKTRVGFNTVVYGLPDATFG